MVAVVCAAVLAFAAGVSDVDGAGGKGKAVVVVDLNVASAEELCTLPGIGPKKADAILALRHKKPFTRVTQLLQVKGIGPKTLDKLKPHLRLSAPSVSAPAPVSTAPVPAPAASARREPVPPLAPLVP